MAHQFIKTDSELQTFLTAIESFNWIALDTEFHSMKKQRPQLCLLQVAVTDQIVLIDPLGITDLSPFWERLCDPQTKVIVHAGRAEMQFCQTAIGRMPQNVFDVQLAAAFVGFIYPISFKTLADQTINIRLSKEETRTNWLRRPLSVRQIDYAIDDVRYLKKITKHLEKRLEQVGRLPWFFEEYKALQSSWSPLNSKDAWNKRLFKRLSNEQIVIAREICQWRQQEAALLNITPKSVLRDDLIVELAVRMDPAPESILAIRDLEQYPQYIDTLSAIIERAKMLEATSIPPSLQRVDHSKFAAEAHFIQTVLGEFAKKKKIAPNLLATLNDTREYLAYYFGALPVGVIPRLGRGWRHELLGNFLNEVLQGKIALKLDPLKSGRAINLLTIPIEEQGEG